MRSKDEILADRAKLFGLANEAHQQWSRSKDKQQQTETWVQYTAYLDQIKLLSHEIEMMGKSRFVLIIGDRVF